MENTKNNEYFIKEIGINYYYRMIKDILFHEQIKKNKISEKEVIKIMDYFNLAYSSVKIKFQNIKRETEGRYFDHQVNVMLLMLHYSDNPSILKVIGCLEHDTIEDTDEDFQSLKKEYSEEEALVVQLISKNPFYKYIKDEEDLKIFEEIKLSGILNDKGLLSDGFLKKYNNNEENLSSEEKNALKKYNELKIKYKEEKNEDFFSHMKDFNTFYEYALILKEKYSIKMPNKEIINLCRVSLEIKFWDRIHNLMTSEIYLNYTEDNLNKALRKIEETKKYFYPISKQTHPKIFTNIESEVAKLENYIEIKSNKDKINKII